LDQELIQVIFGLKLKVLRQQKKISLKGLAAASHLSASYINEIEKGKKYPKPEKIVALAGALDVSYDHLVSTEMDEVHTPLATVLEAPLLRKFPFHIFGTSARELLQLMAGHPYEMSILARMLTELGRNYDMRVEHFFYTALRCYQVLENNYFEDIEEKVSSFRREMGWRETDPIDFETLAEILTARYGYAFDRERLRSHEQLEGLRTALAEGPTLLLNPDLSPPQQAFAAARELGYHLLGAGERGICSPAMEVGTFDQVYNDFRASYFASALLVPTARLASDLGALFARETWSPQAILDLLEGYHTTPEMLFYRLSEVIPHTFRTKRIHFMKFTKRGDHVSLDKQLNMSRVHVPNGIGLKEHFCRRWLSVSILWELERLGGNGPVVGAQVSDFLGFGSEFFCIAVAYRNPLEPRDISSVTLGFQVDKALQRTVRFWNDPSIPRRRLGQTCERCPLSPPECEERAAPAILHEQELREGRRREAIKALLASVGSEEATSRAKSATKREAVLTDP